VRKRGKASVFSKKVGEILRFDEGPRQEALGNQGWGEKTIYAGRFPDSKLNVEWGEGGRDRSSVEMRLFNLRGRKRERLRMGRPGKEPLILLGKKKDPPPKWAHDLSAWGGGKKFFHGAADQGPETRKSSKTKRCGRKILAQKSDPRNRKKAFHANKRAGRAERGEERGEAQKGGHSRKKASCLEGGGGRRGDAGAIQKGRGASHLKGGAAPKGLEDGGEKEKWIRGDDGETATIGCMGKFSVLEREHAGETSQGTNSGEKKDRRWRRKKICCSLPGKPPRSWRTTREGYGRTAGITQRKERS